MYVDEIHGYVFYYDFFVFFILMISNLKFDMSVYRSMCCFCLSSSVFLVLLLYMIQLEIYWLCNQVTGAQQREKTDKYTDSGAPTVFIGLLINLINLVELGWTATVCIKTG